LNERRGSFFSFEFYESSFVRSCIKREIEKRKETGVLKNQSNDKLKVFCFAFYLVVAN
jgi:hypothetical protein